MNGDVKEGVARGEFAQVGTSCVITLYYVLSDDRVERRCDDVQERQRVLPACVFEILREKCYSLVTSSHRISPRDLNSHQPVGIELGLSRNSVSKLGTVRSTVGQRVDSVSIVDTVLQPP